MRQVKSKSIDPWSALEAELRKPRENKPQGDGWLTFNGLMKRFGKGDRSIRMLLADLKKQGRLEVHKGSENRGGDQAQKQVWYRPKA